MQKFLVLLALSVLTSCAPAATHPQVLQGQSTAQKLTVRAFALANFTGERGPFVAEYLYNTLEDAGFRVVDGRSIASLSDADYVINGTAEPAGASSTAKVRVDAASVRIVDRGTGETVRSYRRDASPPLTAILAMPTAKGFVEEITRFITRDFQQVR